MLLEPKGSKNGIDHSRFLLTACGRRTCRSYCRANPATNCDLCVWRGDGWITGAGWPAGRIDRAATCVGRLNRIHLPMSQISDQGMLECCSRLFPIPHSSLPES